MPSLPSLTPVSSTATTTPSPRVTSWASQTPEVSMFHWYPA